MPKLTPWATKRQWYQRHRQGDGIAQIARESKKDPRTVDRAIREVRQQEMAAASRQRLLDEGLSQHLAELLALLGDVAGWVEAPLPTLSVCLAPTTSTREPLAFGAVVVTAEGSRYEKVLLPMDVDRERSFQWDLLREHLGKGAIFTRLRSWRDAVLGEINARLDILALMDNDLSEAGIEIADSLVPPSVLRPWAYCAIGDAAIALALDAFPIPPPQALETDSEGLLTWDQKTAGRLATPGERPHLQQLPTLLAASEAGRDLKAAHAAAVGASDLVREAAFEIRAGHYLPGACRACKRIGMS